MMYALWYSAGQYDDYYIRLVFVTADKSLAEKSVKTATAEMHQARRIKQKEVPMGNRNELETWIERRTAAHAEYNAKLDATLKVDRDCGLESDGYYYVKEVEVR